MLQRKAIDAGLAIVCTYGMSETAGGCVYDGVPLDGVEVRIDTPAGGPGPGRIVLGGPMVAHGYRNLPDHPAFASSPTGPRDGARQFRTDDLGVVEAGLLRVVGQADQAISTGGLTVLPGWSSRSSSPICRSPSAPYSACATRGSVRGWWPSSCRPVSMPPVWTPTP